ncbi:hypothetical protein [Streptomyces aculeolatus]|uniref:hypothetical protein n=1 Tax=Streptomyces aculeolatus TaxID=270689 RepID=UPI001CECDB54|nr:hypothetical protein [Streptomyces aculeolatus]
MTEDAETACRALMRICADWESAAHNFLAEEVDSDLLESSVNFLSLTQSAQCLSYLARIVTEGERFTFARIRDCVESHVVQINNPMLTHLYEKNRSLLDSTWEKSLNSLRDWMLVDLRDARGWQTMKVLIELRNASAHGGGRFTDRQRKNSQEFKKLVVEVKAMGYEIQNLRVIAYPDSVRDAAYAVREFILSVDSFTQFG